MRRPFVCRRAFCRPPEDGDVGAVFGLGFPPFLGGPFNYVDSLGAARIVTEMERLRAAYGQRFEPAQILRQMAENGSKFYSG